MLVFIDTEFTHSTSPELLSIGLVTDDGRELYCELDLDSDIGKARVKAASDFVQYGVLIFWGAVPGAACSELEMGQRIGTWLLDLAAEAQARNEKLEIAFDYETDYALMCRTIQAAGLWGGERKIVNQINVNPITDCIGLWSRVRKIVSPINVISTIDCIEGDSIAEACFYDIDLNRGLQRHHALADAVVLRETYLKLKSDIPNNTPVPL